MDTYTTPQVAEQLGITPEALGNWLKRNPDYRPTRRIGFNLLWTAEEIDRVRQGRAETSKRKTNPR